MKKMFLKYYGDLLLYNIQISVALTSYIVFSGPIDLFLKTGINDFKAEQSSTNSAMFIGAVSFLLIGYLFSITMYQYLYEKEYYFYYNVGFSKKKLLTYSFLFNAFLYFLLIALISVLKLAGII